MKPDKECVLLSWQHGPGLWLWLITVYILFQITWTAIISYQLISTILWINWYLISNSWNFHTLHKPTYLLSLLDSFMHVLSICCIARFGYMVDDWGSLVWILVGSRVCILSKWFSMFSPTTCIFTSIGDFKLPPGVSVSELCICDGVFRESCLVCIPCSSPMWGTVETELGTKWVR